MESRIFGKFGGEVPQTFLAAIQSYAKLSPLAPTYAKTFIVSGHLLSPKVALPIPSY
jgi:hypothetical protein